MPKPPSNKPPGGSIKDFVPETIVDPFADMTPAVEPTPPPVETPPPALPHEDAPDADEQPLDIKQFVPQELDEDPITGRKREPKAPENKPPKEHTSEIRKQLEKVNAEKKAVEDELQKLRDLQTQHETKYKELETQFQTVGSEYEEFKKKQSIGDPYQLKEVQDIILPFKQSVNSLSLEMQDDGVDNYNKLSSWLEQAVPRFMRASAVDKDGKRDDDAYRAEFEALRTEAADTFGPDFTRQVMKHVRTGADNAWAAAKAVHEAQSNIPVHHFREAMRIYEAEASEYEQIERSLFDPPEDIKMNDPLNPTVIIRAMMDGSEEVRKVAQNAKLATRLGMLPVKPVDPNSVEAERLQDVIRSTMGNHTQHFKKIRSILPEALVARAVLPALWRELETLRAQVKSQRDTPRPKLDGQSQVQPDEEEIDIRKFEPTNPALEEFERSTKRR